MRQVAVYPKSGDLLDAASAFEKLVPVDVLGLQSGRQRYAFFTNETGGIEDDLMIANRGDHLLAVVNAACKTADIEHMQATLSGVCDVKVLTDRALIALQGPKAVNALEALTPGCGQLRFMDIQDLEICGATCVASRSGYTGEDGFEISIPEDAARTVVDALLAHEAVELIGLGARDSLRLEAGLCLYGNDINSETTPVSAALTWAIQKVRRKGGEARERYGPCRSSHVRRLWTERRRTGCHGVCANEACRTEHTALCGSTRQTPADPCLQTSLYRTRV